MYYSHTLHQQGPLCYDCKGEESMNTMHSSTQCGVRMI
jgi:hypothetical protein